MFISSYSKFFKNFLVVFTPAIHNSIWGGYIPPEKDEIFPSWLCRLAKAHYLKSQSFSHTVLRDIFCGIGVMI